MVNKIVFLFLCLGNYLNAVVVMVSASNGEILNWSAFENLNQFDVLEITFPSTTDSAQLLASGNMTILPTITSNGSLRFTSSSGTITHEGTIETAGVIFEAKKILLMNHSVVDTSGSMGGGNIYIGGGWHGMDPGIQNAKTVGVDSTAIIRSDALANGNGGIVVIWSDVATGFIGSIASTGLNGNGGQVEISSKRYLILDGSVDVSATNGSDGMLFLDPLSITVQAANPDIDGNGTNLDITFVTQLDDATTTPAGFPNANSIITAGALAALLTNNVSLTLAAQDFITFNAALSPAGMNVTLTLEAPTVNLNNPITLASGGVLAGSGVTTVNVGASGNPQNGIDIAASGTVVNLAAATYTVSPAAFNIINKNLTLNGQGIGSTTISLVGAVPTHSSRNPMIYVQGGTNTVIQNMSLDGNNIGFPTNGNITGILYSDAGGIVSNVHVTEIANSAPPYGGGQQGVAIRGSSAVGPLNFNVTDCTIDHFQKAAIVANGSLIIDISGNVITGLGTTSTPSAIGIQISSGATGSVTGNNISGIQFADHASSQGILAFIAGDNLIISNNILSNNDEGVLSLDTGAGLTISDNMISNSGDTGIIAADTAGNTIISGNTLTNNGGLAGPAAGNTGIYLFSSSLQTFEVTQNSITPAPGTSAIFTQGNAVGQAPDVSLLQNIFIDP